MIGKGKYMLQITVITNQQEGGLNTELLSNTGIIVYSNISWQKRGCGARYGSLSGHGRVIGKYKYIL